jgi:hypothetical protein
MSMTFDTKIAIVVRDDLPAWQKLNVTAYVASALVSGDAGLIGDNYVDASGNLYLPMVIQPMMIYAADEAGIRKAYTRAMERGMKIAIFTRELFSTGNDIDNRAEVRARTADQLDLVGLAIRDQKKEVDKVIKGLKFHP